MIICLKIHIWEICGTFKKKIYSQQWHKYDAVHINDGHISRLNK